MEDSSFQYCSIVLVNPTMYYREERLDGCAVHELSLANGIVPI